MQLGLEATTELLHMLLLGMLAVILRRLGQQSMRLRGQLASDGFLAYNFPGSTLFRAPWPHLGGRRVPKTSDSTKYIRYLSLDFDPAAAKWSQYKPSLIIIPRQWGDKRYIKLLMNGKFKVTLCPSKPKASPDRW